MAECKQYVKLLMEYASMPKRRDQIVDTKTEATEKELLKWELTLSSSDIIENTKIAFEKLKKQMK